MNFYVGQRVRIIFAPYELWALGREATITSALDEDGDYALVVDGSPKTWYAAPSSLEPILPPKSQETITWDECDFDRDGKWRERVPA